MRPGRRQPRMETRGAPPCEDLLTRLCRDAPAEVWDKCLDAVWEGESCRKGGASALLALPRVNRQLRGAMGAAAPVWGRACLRAAGLPGTPPTVSEALLDELRVRHARDRLRLACFTGCMWCGAARIRKAYPRYGVRACDACLRSRSVSEFELEREYGVGRGGLDGLPSHMAPFYNRFGGQGDMECFLWDDVLRKHGVSSREELKRLAGRVDDESAPWASFTRLQKEALRWRDVVSAAEEIVGAGVERALLVRCPSVRDAASKLGRRFSERQKSNMAERVRSEYAGLVAERDLLSDAPRIQAKLRDKLAERCERRRCTPEEREALRQCLVGRLSFDVRVAATGVKVEARCPVCRGCWGKTQGLLDHFSAMHLADAARERSAQEAPRECGCCGQPRDPGHKAACAHRKRTCAACLRADGGATRAERRESLLAALAEVGCELRGDSSLCAAYLRGTSGRPAAAVAATMARFKYLMEGYCPEFEAQLADAERQLEDMVERLRGEEGGYYSGINADARSELARDGVFVSRSDLAETWGTFPDAWPWLQ